MVAQHADQSLVVLSSLQQQTRIVRATPCRNCFSGRGANFDLAPEFGIQTRSGGHIVRHGGLRCGGREHRLGARQIEKAHVAINCGRFSMRKGRGRHRAARSTNRLKSA